MRDKRIICDRKKLYKSGKMLVTAGIFSAVMFGVSIANVSADSINNTSIAVAQSKNIAVATTTATMDKVTDTTATTDKVTDTTATTDKVTDTAATTDKAANTTVTPSEKSKSIKQIDGKTYFIGDDGQPKKNFTAIVDGQVLYFDKDTGALTSNSSQYTDGLVNIGNEHNAAYSLSSDSFTQVDGYLTANSWYRPKDILKNGTTWTASTANDFRPLLMSWWPDKDTQVSYLKYMQSVGLLSDDVVLSNKDSMNSLTAMALTVQKNIEEKIGLLATTDWLKTDMDQMVDSQSNWNISSESKGTDHLQGGALLYVNSDLTPNANSDYRLLNRTPTNQKGQITTDGNQGGYEMLLANDVDNSNPIVQAEQLNWLYYMMNIGSIVQNDPTANFDGYRVDAVDNVNADLLQIAGDYFKAAYGTDKSDANANNHISILEDWDNNDPAYVKSQGNNQSTMDFPMHLALKYSLNMPSSARSGLEPDIVTSLVNRSEDSTENEAQPNYSFIRAHDSEVQTVIAQIIKDKINPSSDDGLTVSTDEIAKAFEIYNADELKADKEYTAYNIPSSYALLLTNKDTIPRVYYGDLFTDDGKYMSAKSPYYDALTSLLQSRVKYVSGGQSMNMAYLHNNQGLLTSVRYGKGAMKATDTGTSETRTQGIGLIVSNKTDLNLNNDEQIVLNMGAAHKNQAYRALMLSTKDGLKIYNSDDDASLAYTDDQGRLTFKSDMVFGVSDAQVSGYLAAWVPVGATDDQDARSQSSTIASTDGNTYHSNAALDSQVIYEGFSNFQAMPTQTNEYTNVKIAQNAQLFKNLGITSFELAPQYRSSTDNSFLDAVVQNGYAFTDRYDIGYNTPTKYGTVDQLLDALRALHAQGIQAINDWVPDQIYNLPSEEIVTASRTNGSGKINETSVINNTLYDSHTVGGGEYQAIYGGAFLDKLKQDFPELFETKQISTGEAINPDVKITEWSAKYFNGSNIQGRGAWYVLKDWATNQYINVSSGSKFLPKQLLGEKTSTGFTNVDNGKTEFYSTSGYQAKNTFIQDNDNWYYFDNDGYMVVGGQEINGKKYYFLPNGVELQDAYLSDGTNVYYYSSTGRQITNQYYRDSDNKWHYFFSDGHMAIGLTTITADNGTANQQYFDVNGVQLKGVAVKDTDGNVRYFDGNTGNLVVSNWGKSADGSWLYLNDKGRAVTGQQNINGQNVYFNEDGVQVKDEAITDTNGNVHYYDRSTGNLVVNSWAETKNGSWLYLNDKGNAVTGEQLINGQKLYFSSNGIQLKNTFKKLSDDSWLYLNDKGIPVTGAQVIDGQTFYFGQDGKQVKGDIATDGQGKTHYYDGNTGNMVTNSWAELPDSSWMYLDVNGIAAIGAQKINGLEFYFDNNGKQVKKDKVINDDGTINYYTGMSGEKLKNDFGELPDGSWMYLDNQGNAVIGDKKINAQNLYFKIDGQQVKGETYIDGVGKMRFYQAASGEMVTNQFEQVADGKWAYFGADGVAVTGEQYIDGQDLFFDPTGYQVKGDKRTIDSVLYSFDKDSGERQRLNTI
ncbi:MULTISPECIES: glycoside hydrolase family 70 protein [unclassified Leuconostoc]|uniref:glycoside hydrolase family 70 protein n=1 Tax=unclassified Leuconostoc TaxID=2685106 RepID=UPI001F4024DC|nr:MULTISPECIES: glycoside hydrolase family 70 protein [unclassified Leuconostoc]